MNLLGLLGRLLAKGAAIADSSQLPPAEHRPWPPPTSPWIMKQTWNNLLFAHWPVRQETVQPLIPVGLTLEKFEGDAWIGITPFTITRLRARGLPAIPKLSAFPEINVRTYVTAGGKPGVFFFSLDAGSRAAVAAARAVYSLPYFNAKFQVRSQADGITYSSRRVERTAPPAAFQARYRPLDPPSIARPGTLDHWLTERYCLYAVDRRGGLTRAEIHHRAWPLQRAEAPVLQNRMTTGLGFDLPPIAGILHFAAQLDVYVWPPDSVTTKPL